MSSCPVHSCIIGGRKNNNWWHCFAANCSQGILKGSPNSDKLNAWTLLLLWQKIFFQFVYLDPNTWFQTIVWWSRKIPWCRLQQWQRCAEMTGDKTAGIERTHRILISPQQICCKISAGASLQMCKYHTPAATMGLALCDVSFSSSGSVLYFCFYSRL